MKNNKGLIIILVSIIVILLVVIGLVFTGVISLDNGNKLNCGNSEVIESDIVDNNNSNSVNGEVNNSVDNVNGDTYDNEGGLIVSEQDKNDEEVVEFDLDERVKISDYNSIKSVYNNDVSVRLGVDGNVYVNLDNKITNVKDVVDILLFNKFNYDILYILDKNGDVYKYYVKSNNYSAEKIDKVNNIEKIFKYSSSKKNAGGCSYLIALSKDGKYYRLNSLCV